MKKSRVIEDREALLKKEILTPAEAAVVLGCSYGKIQELLQSGRLKYGAIGPRLKRISRASIDKFMASCGGEK